MQKLTFQKSLTSAFIFFALLIIPVLGSAQKASAKINSKDKIVKKGQDINLSIQLKGDAPFSITYNMDKVNYTIANIADSMLDKKTLNVAVNPQTNADIYLSAMSDANGAGTVNGIVPFALTANWLYYPLDNLILNKTTVCSGEPLTIYFNPKTNLDSVIYQYSINGGASYQFLANGVGSNFQITTQNLLNITTSTIQVKIRAKVFIGSDYQYSNISNLSLAPASQSPGFISGPGSILCYGDVLNLTYSKNHSIMVLEHSLDGQVIANSFNVSSNMSNIYYFNSNLTSAGFPNPSRITNNYYRIKYKDGQCDYKFSPFFEVNAQYLPEQIWIDDKIFINEVCENSSFKISGALLSPVPPTSNFQISWQISEDNKTWVDITNSNAATKMINSNWFEYEITVPPGTLNGKNYYVRAKNLSPTCPQFVNYSGYIILKSFEKPTPGDVVVSLNTTCSGAKVKVNLINYKGKIKFWEVASINNNNFSKYWGGQIIPNTNPYLFSPDGTFYPSTDSINYFIRAITYNNGCPNQEISDTAKVTEFKTPVNNFQEFPSSICGVVNDGSSVNITKPSTMDTQKYYWMVKNSENPVYSKANFPLTYSNLSDTLKRFEFKYYSEYCPDHQFYPNKVANVLPKGENYPVDYPAKVCSNSPFDVTAPGLNAFNIATIFKYNPATSSYIQLKKDTIKVGEKGFNFPNLIVTQTTNFKIIFDKLIYNGCYTSIFKEFTVEAINKPSNPSLAAGVSTSFCQGGTNLYDLNSDSDTNSYTLQLIPFSAGTMQLSGDKVTVNWSSNFNGTVLLKAVANNSCSQSDTSVFQFTSVSKPNFSIQGLKNEYCYWENFSSITVLPFGGYFSGSNGIKFDSNTNEFVFNPYFANSGENTIVYHYTDPSNGCSSEFETSTFVHPMFLWKSYNENIVSCPGQTKTITHHYSGTLDSLIWFYKPKNVFGAWTKVIPSSAVSMTQTDSTFSISIVSNGELNNYEIFPRIYSPCNGIIAGPISYLKMTDYPDFIKQPKSTTVCEGNVLIHQTTINNPNQYTMLWQENMLNGLGFVNTTNTSSSYSKNITSTTPSNFQVRVVVNGTCGTFYSDTAFNIAKRKPSGIMNCAGSEGRPNPGTVDLCIFDWDWSHPYYFALYDSSMNLINYYHPNPYITTPYLTKNTQFYLTQINTELNCESDPLSKYVTIGNDTVFNKMKYLSRINFNLNENSESEALEKALKDENLSPEIKNKLCVYPNPCSSILNIKSDNLGEITQIIIKDIQGKIIYETAPSAAQIIKQIDVSKWEPGNYFMNYISTNSSQVSTFQVK